MIKTVHIKVIYTYNNISALTPTLLYITILSNILNYIQYDRHPKNYHNLGISTVNKYKNSLDAKEEGDKTELDFGSIPHMLKEECLDIYKGIQSEIVNTITFDENSDLSTTYLGKSDRTKMTSLKQRNLFQYQKKAIH